MKADKFIRKWGKTRAKGKLFYVLSSTLPVAAGVFSGHLVSNFLSSGTFFYEGVFLDAIGAVIGGAIGGAIGGSIRWSINEEKYREYTTKTLDN